MTKPALMLLAAAALLATAGAASAQYYGGGPYYGDPGPNYRQQYRDRYIDDDDYRYERRRYNREQRGYRTWNGCPPNYTIQDGVCKPYTGR